MKKKLIGVFIVLLFVVSFSRMGYTDEPQYVIGFKYVQHRTLENGKTINLVAVGMNYSGTNDLHYLSLDEDGFTIIKNKICLT